MEITLIEYPTIHDWIEVKRRHDVQLYCRIPNLEWRENAVQQVFTELHYIRFGFSFKQISRAVWEKLFMCLENGTPYIRYGEQNVNTVDVIYDIDAVSFLRRVAAIRTYLVNRSPEHSAYGRYFTESLQLINYMLDCIKAECCEFKCIELYPSDE